MMTPPLSCSAIPRLTRSVPVDGELSCWDCGATGLPLDRRKMFESPSYGRSGSPPTAFPCPGDREVEAVVDVEEPRLGPRGVQAEQPGQPAAPQFAGIPDGVVVEAPGQGHPRAGAGQVAA